MPIPPPESRENDVGAAVTPAPTVAPRGVFRRRKQNRDEAILLVRFRLATSSDADGPGLGVGTVSEPCELARGLVADGRAGNARPRRRCPPARFRVRRRSVHCALNCCSTTVLAPWASVAVTRRVTLPLTCRSEICAAKEPALVRVRVVRRSNVPRPLRMSSVIVAGSDTVRWSVSRRPLARSVRLTMAGRSSIETVGGVFPTARVVVVVALVVVELVVVVVGRVVVVLLVVERVLVVGGRVVLVVVVGGRVVVVDEEVVVGGRVVLVVVV